MGAGEVNGLVLAATSDNLSSHRVYAFDHDFHDLPQVPGIIDPLNLALPVKRNFKPGHLLGLWDGIDHGQGRGVGPTGVLEAEDAIVLDLV